MRTLALLLILVALASSQPRHLLLALMAAIARLSGM